MLRTAAIALLSILTLCESGKAFASFKVEHSGISEILEDDVQVSSDSLQRLTPELQLQELINADQKISETSDSIGSGIELKENRYSQQTDSVVSGYKDLGEIVVLASREVRLKEGMAYIPDKAQKRFATDGVSLLARMMIPTLKIKICTAALSSLSGEVRCDSSSTGFRPHQKKSLR